MMKNKLLARIPRKELEPLLAQLHEVALPFKKVLSDIDEKIEYAYFVSNGVVSVVNEPDNGDIVEVATIGNEGMVGFPIVLGTSSIPSRVLVQVAGSGLRISASDLLACLRQTPILHRLLMRYVMAVMNQIAQSTSCNRLHQVQERCARWLLHTHDRVEGDSFEITQEFLSQMLGVHRPTVTIAARMLQQAGLIRYTRGKIEIIDRPGLEAASCNCYRLIVDQYERLLERD
jgi:CRP-like cAMP-binding protein